MNLIAISLLTLFVGTHCHRSVSETRGLRRREEPQKYPNGRPLVITAESKIITQRNVLDMGWFEFAFGSADTFLPRHYEVESDSYVTVSIADFGCLGDSFSLHAILKGNQKTKIGSTNMVRSDGCMLVEFSPDVAFESSQFSSGQWTLAPGKYLLQISVDASPYKGGTAAIKFDEIDYPDNDIPLIELDETDEVTTLCPARSRAGEKRLRDGRSKGKKNSGKALCTGDDGFHIVLKPSRFLKAQQLCGRYGMIPAKLKDNNRTKESVLAVLDRCLGKRQKVWIGTMKGHGKSHKLTAEARAGNVLRIHETDSSTKLPIMCQDA